MAVEAAAAVTDVDVVVDDLLFLELHRFKLGLNDAIVRSLSSLN